jgi:hypothetical protein
MALNLIIATLLTATVGLVTYLLICRKAHLRADALCRELAEARDMILDDQANIVAMNGGAMTLAKTLAKANTLTFEFTPFDGSPQVMHFDLRGLGSHLVRVAEACGWSMD